MFLRLLIGLLLSTSALAQNPDRIFMKKGVSQLWQTDPVLATPESVTYEPVNEVLFVSNMAGGAQQKDEKGFISKVTLEGKMLEKRFISGLNAPKGMAIYEGKLYVTDIDAIKAFRLKDGKKQAVFKAPKAEFLNDLAVTTEGRLIATDMYAHRLYTVNNGKAKIWKSDDFLKRPNGILVRATTCWVGNKNWLAAYKLPEGKGRQLKGKTGPIDGLEQLGPDKFLTSDWQGRLYLQIFKDGNHERQKLLDTRAVKHRVADFTYIPDKQMVIVPTFTANKLTAYKLPF